MTTVRDVLDLARRRGPQGVRRSDAEALQPGAGDFLVRLRKQGYLDYDDGVYRYVDTAVRVVQKRRSRVPQRGPIA